MPNKCYKKLIIMLLACLVSQVYAQQTVWSNEVVQMHTNAELTINGGLFADNDFRGQSGRVHFTGRTLQAIGGNGASILFDRVVVENDANIDLRVPVTNKTNLTFSKGAIVTPRVDPSIMWLFGSTADYTGANNGRHIHGYAAHQGQDSFFFPIGDGFRLRPAAVAGAQDPNAVFRAAYFRGNPTVATLPSGAPFSTAAKAFPIDRVGEVEYWDIDGRASARLTLTWNLQSNIAALVFNDLSRLTVAAFDGTEWVNLDIESVTGNISNGSITTIPIVPSQYKAYTFAQRNSNWPCQSTAPVLNLGNDRIICANEFVQIRPGRYTRYLWSNSSTDSVLTTTVPGLYWVKVWDNCGNVQTDSVWVRQGALPSAITALPASCFGRQDGRIVVQETTGVTISLNNVAVDRSILNGLPAGLYAVSVGLTGGCRLDTLVRITEPAQQRITLGADTIRIDDGQTIQLTATPTTGYVPTTYTWLPPQYISCQNCPTVEVTPLSSATVRVETTDVLGCSSTDSVVVLLNKKYGLYIPNAFNPEKEDYTVLGTDDVQKIVSMKIFDRWGSLIYEARDFKPNGSVGWDGTFRGQPVNTGSYVVSVEALFINGETRKFATDLLVTR